MVLYPDTYELGMSNLAIQILYLRRGGLCGLDVGGQSVVQFPKAFCKLLIAGLLILHDRTGIEDRQAATAKNSDEVLSPIAQPLYSQSVHLRITDLFHIFGI